MSETMGKILFDFIVYSSWNSSFNVKNVKEKQQIPVLRRWNQQFFILLETSLRSFFDYQIICWLIS